MVAVASPSAAADHNPMPDTEAPAALLVRLAFLL